MSKKKSSWLTFRNYVEVTLNNRVKNYIGSDLFDILLLLLWAAISFCLAIPLFADEFGTNPTQELSGFVQAQLLWFTAFAIVRYTKETYWQKKIAQKQYDYETMPLIRLRYSTSRRDQVFRLDNIGRGVAKNVSVSPFDVQRDPHLVVRIKKRPLMTPGGSSSVSEQEIKEGSLEWFLNLSVASFIDARLQGNHVTTNIQLKYEDLRGNKYISTYKADETYNDRFRLVSHKQA